MVFNESQTVNTKAKDQTDMGLACNIGLDMTLGLQRRVWKTKLHEVVAKALVRVMPAKALMPTMLVQEHKDKTITHMVHEVLTWFGQPCLRPRMREDDSTIQQRILQRTEPDTTIGFLKHPMFPHSSYPYLTTSPLAPSGTSCFSSHLYPPRIVSTGPSPSHNFFPS